MNLKCSIVVRRVTIILLMIQVDTER